MLLVIAFMFPVILGCVCSLLIKEESARNRALAGTLLGTDVLALVAAFRNESVTLFTLSENVNITFETDAFGRFVLLLVLTLYTAVCFYAFEYMKMEEHPHVFFAFYFVSLGAMIAVCLSGNLVTMYFCFEFATLSSVPMVLHEMTRDAVTAGLKYLFYSIAGALMGLFSVFFVYYYGGGTFSFIPGGFLDMARVAGHEKVLLAAVFAGIIGFGTKAGIYPMHGWLPTAHPIAPAPASSLLSGIIAKAGIVAIVRLVYYSVGPEFLADTWVQYVWMSLAMVTIFMGSMMAFREKVMKKRLAYSTVSQISYIMLGLSQLSKEGFSGGLLHMMSHCVSKGCLFLVAGVFIYKLGRRNVAELKGVGKQMPVTMWCFMIASLSLVGIPPMGGFTSKWVIALAAVGSGRGIFSILPPIILLISALLTAGYLFPVAVDAFFPGNDFNTSGLKKAEPSVLMLIPMIVLCAAALAAGTVGTEILTLFHL